MIYTFLTMALLLELVDSLEMTASQTFPIKGATGQRKHPAEPIGNSDHLSIIIELNHKICYKPASQDLLDGVGMVLIGPVLLTKSNQK